MPDDLCIRVVDQVADYRQLEDVQRDAWAMSDLDIMPVHSFCTYQHTGGVTLAAFTPAGEAVGFVLGVPGVDEADLAGLMGQRVYQVSYMMGVRRAYQGRGVGQRLKWAQRQWALEHNLPLVAWTYDPLLARNATLNIARLGGVVRRYHRNLYGPMTGINAGLESDRFEVEWWLHSRRVAHYEAGQVARRGRAAYEAAGAVVLLSARRRPDGLFEPPTEEDLPAAPQILIEFPSDFDAVKAADMGLALAWRECSRVLFEAAFADGYTLVDVLSEPGRAFYGLARGIDRRALARGEDED